MPSSISPVLTKAVERERQHLDVVRPYLARERDCLRRPRQRHIGVESESAKWARSSDTHAAATLGGWPSTSSAARSAQPEASVGPLNAYASPHSWIASRAAVAASRARDGSHARATRSRPQHRARNGRRDPPPRRRLRRLLPRERVGEAHPCPRPMRCARAPPARPRSLYWARPNGVGEPNCASARHPRTGSTQAFGRLMQAEQTRLGIEALLRSLGLACWPLVRRSRRAGARRPRGHSCGACAAATPSITTTAVSIGCAHGRRAIPARLIQVGFSPGPARSSAAPPTRWSAPPTPTAARGEMRQAGSARPRGRCRA